MSSRTLEQQEGVKGVCSTHGFLLFIFLGLSAHVELSDGKTAATQETITGSFLLNSTGSTPIPSSSGNDSRPNHLSCAHRPIVRPHYNRMTPPTINFTAVERKHGIKCGTGPGQQLGEHCSIKIKIKMDLLQIRDVIEDTGLVRLMMIFRQYWSDNRLEIPPEYSDECPDIQQVNNGSASFVPAYARKTVWLPDIYINRIEKVFRPYILVEAETFRVTVHGDIKYTMFGVVSLSCAMDFRNFPMDVQYCPLYIESWRLDDSDQKIMWASKQPFSALKEYSLDQFSFSIRVLKVDTKRYETGNFSRIGVVFIFSRELQFYVLQIYFPTVLFVIISWLTFIIPPGYAQGRIILTITTMLTLAALFSLVGMHSPSSSYLKAIDVWMFVCLVFVFAAVVDCLVDIRLLFVVSQSYKREKLGFLTPVSVALVENREVFEKFFGTGDDEVEATPSVYFDVPSHVEQLPATEVRSILRTRSTTEDRSRLTVNFAKDAATTASGSAMARASSVQLTLDESETTQVRWSNIAILFEKSSLIVYPIAFLVFNIGYWAYYLNASKPEERLAREMKGGFTPIPRA